MLRATCSLGINRLSRLRQRRTISPITDRVGLVKGPAYSSAVVPCPFLSRFQTAGVALGVSLPEPKAEMSSFSAQLKITPSFRL